MKTTGVDAAELDRVRFGPRQVVFFNVCSREPSVFGAVLQRGCQQNKLKSSGAAALASGRSFRSAGPGSVPKQRFEHRSSTGVPKQVRKVLTDTFSGTGRELNRATGPNVRKDVPM